MRCAIVGFGGIAERAHLPALRAASIDVAVVVEPAAARRQVAAQTCPEASLHETLSDGLAAARRAASDFALICTPPAHHSDGARAALQAGLHVLCEKPWVLQLSDAATLIELAAARRRVLGCVNNWTAAPGIRAAWAWAQQHGLGELRELHQRTLRTKPAAAAEAWRQNPAVAGGGILFDHGWHGLTIMLRSFADALPSDLQAQLSHAGRPLSTASGVAEDTVSLKMAYPDGRLATYYATWGAAERANVLEFVHRRGRLVLDGDQLTCTDADGRVLQQQRFAPSLAAGGYRADWMQVLLGEFLEEIATPEAPRRLQTESLQALTLIRQAYAQAA